jgi:hypothetical protein
VLRALPIPLINLLECMFCVFLIALNKVESNFVYIFQPMNFLRYLHSIYSELSYVMQRIQKESQPHTCHQIAPVELS